MKTTKDIILPAIPRDASPEMQRFCESLIKVINDQNKNLYADLKGIAAPTSETVTTGNRDQTAGKPVRPKLGALYVDKATNRLYVCTGYNTADEAVWGYVLLT